MCEKIFPFLAVFVGGKIGGWEEFIETFLLTYCSKAELLPS
jgi:hypothetical protein